MMRQPSGELLPVCDDGWNMAAAHVACRKLGFTRALEAKNGSQYPGIHTDEFALDQVQCRGLEDSLLNCSFTAAEDCDAGEAAGVVCDPTPQQVIADNISQRIESCYARNVLYGLPLSSTETLFLPTVLDCQELCGREEPCITFSYNTTSRECRMRGLGTAEQECERSKVQVSGVSYDDRRFLPINVLTKETDDSRWIDDRSISANYWLSQNGRKGPSQYFVMDLGCKSQVKGVQLVNTHNGSHKDRAMKLLR